MKRPEFNELPFSSRPDLSPYLVHLTKASDDGYSAYKNLVSILKTGEIWGSNGDGFIKDNLTATCFMDVPLSALKYVATKANAKRYAPYGIMITKPYAYKKGARPVLYLSNSEMSKLKIPAKERWRVVRFEVEGKNWLSFMHEREWRVQGDFKLPDELLVVFVKNTTEAKKLTNLIERKREEFKVIPKAIIPLNILSQGLIY